MSILNISQLLEKQYYTNTSINCMDNLISFRDIISGNGISYALCMIIVVSEGKEIISYKYKKFPYTSSLRISGLEHEDYVPVKINTPTINSVREDNLRYSDVHLDYKLQGE